jgi:hypothetical protein
MIFGTRCCIDGEVFPYGSEEYVVFTFKCCEFARIVSNMGARWRCVCMLVRLVKCGECAYCNKARVLRRNKSQNLRSFDTNIFIEGMAELEQYARQLTFVFKNWDEIFELTLPLLPDRTLVLCRDMFCKIYLFVSGATAPLGPGSPQSRDFWIIHSDVPQSVWLPWTNDQLVAEASSQKTLIREKHQCPRWDSNSQSQASGRISTP